jgi:tetratricopeptide (TPR) repeat protein
MGVQLEKDIDYVGQYLELLGNVIAKQTAIPLATVFCGYLYQIEEKDYAIKFLNEVLEINPDYSLAKLLYRVFIAQWPTGEFKKMAEQLHPSVLENIYSINTEVITNDN